MWFRGAVVAIAVLLAVGCNTTTPSPFNCPKVFSIASGNNQRAPGSDVLGSLLAVSAEVSPGKESSVCTALNPQIAWSVQTGGGSIAPVAATFGRMAVWTLGPTPGTQTVRATWNNSGESTAPFVIFSAVAE
jgi:hypothetical protein